MRTIQTFLHHNWASIVVSAFVLTLATLTHQPGILLGVACTLTARSYKPNAAGALTHKMWNLSGDNAYTFDTGIKSVRTVAFFLEPTSLVTAITQSTVNGQIRLTFTASGPFANMDLLAILRNG